MENFSEDPVCIILSRLFFTSVSSLHSSHIYLSPETVSHNDNSFFESLKAKKSHKIEDVGSHHRHHFIEQE